MRIGTWNINSFRARQERVEACGQEVQPDVLLLQETKLADDAFPTLAFEALGYACAHYGQGRWNGVAILSKVGLEDVVCNFAGDGDLDPDARITTATCGGVRVSSVYVPSGRSLDDDHYIYKLWWLGRLLEHLDADTSPDQAVVVGGDKMYSWWDYRGGDLHQGRGMRIDLLMCSPSVVDRAEWTLVDRNARKGKQPSDHAPVIVDIAEASLLRAGTVRS